MVRNGVQDPLGCQKSEVSTETWATTEPPRGVPKTNWICGGRSMLNDYFNRKTNLQHNRGKSGTTLIKLQIEIEE